MSIDCNAVLIDRDALEIHHDATVLTVRQSKTETI